MIFNDEDVYTHLKKYLGREPRKDIWDELVRDDYVSTAIADDDISEIISRYEKQDKLYPIQKAQKKLRDGTYEEPPDERLKYLSEILSWDAAQEPRVKSFRHDVLNDCLLDPENVKTWIKELEKKEGGIELSTYINARLPPGSENVNPGLVSDRPVLIGKGGLVFAVYEEWFAYSIPNSEISGNIDVKVGAASERLKKISESLHLRYTWPRSQAAGFILTGKIPLLPVARMRFLHLGRSYLSNASFDVSANRAYGEQDNLLAFNAADAFVAASYPSLMTMSIEVSTHLSPKEVARIYSTFKFTLLDLQNVRSQKKYRPMTKKHMELAVFYHKHQGMKGSEMMTVWNKEYPNYKAYFQVTNFYRDAKYAHSRLIGIAKSED